MKDNDMEDNFSRSSDSQRKRIWNEMVKTKREKKSSIVKITAVSTSSSEAQLISKATVSTLFSVVSFYYDIKNDIDLRIIEQPAVRTVSSHWFSAILISLFIGTAISFLINFLSGLISNYFLKKNREIKIDFPKFDFSKKPKTEILKEKSGEISTPDIEIEKAEAKRIETQKSISITTEKKVSAPQNLPGVPENLPFIDEEYFRNNIIKNGVKKEEPKSEIIPEKVITENTAPAPDFHREPTQDELKKRLNQLLKGEL
jgi:hypothetical protein